MKTKTRKALEKSIKHWKRLEKGTQRTGEAPDDVNCALCRRFQDQFPATVACTRTSGEQCPIFKHTGVTHCRNTPYYPAADAWIAVDGSSKAFRRKAKVMRKFLISLRELE